MNLLGEFGHLPYLHLALFWNTSKAYGRRPWSITCAVISEIFYWISCSWHVWCLCFMDTHLHHRFRSGGKQLIISSIYHRMWPQTYHQFQACPTIWVPMGCLTCSHAPARLGQGKDTTPPDTILPDTCLAMLISPLETLLDTKGFLVHLRIFLQVHLGTFLQDSGEFLKGICPVLLIFWL